VTFLGLMLHDVLRRPLRAIVTALAVSHDPRLTSAATRVLRLADGRIEG
jgi:ABC-type lipoprotein export system ATPase subunit